LGEDEVPFDVDVESSREFIGRNCSDWFYGWHVGGITDEDVNGSECLFGGFECGVDCGLVNDVSDEHEGFNAGVRSFDFLSGSEGEEEVRPRMVILVEPELAKA
jgi:hypothetical protein